MLKQTAMIGLALATLVGCGSEKNEPASPPSKAVECEVLPGVTMQVPEGWKLNVEGDVPSIEVANAICHIQLWPVVDAAAPEDALPKIVEVVKGQVLDFKTGQAEDLTIAGRPGKHVIATGVEADDNDPAKVEVFVFTVDGKVYLLLAHSGHENPADHRDKIVGMLDTAEAK